MRARGVLGLGLLWAVTVVGFQLIVNARFAPERPDRVLGWTAAESGARSHDAQVYLLEPFLRESVAWDSEFYLSIAIRGYDDPAVRAVDVDGRKVSLNYAFFPLYPAAIRTVAAPLSGFVNRIAAATLAGVLLSILGALAGAVALYALVRADFSEARAWKSAFFFLAFPTSFFLAQVYTEGLFVGLAFGAMALARHRRLGWAALLAVLATWTRAVGVCLVLPLAWAWLEEWRASGRRRAIAVQVLFALAPIAAFLAWKLSPLGQSFDAVERAHFQRGALDVGASMRSWAGAISQLAHGRAQTRIQYGLELAALAAGLGASLATLRRWPGPSLFGLAAMLLPLTSGVAQGLPRFVLAVPSVFAVLGGMGERSEVADRAWTVASVLLLGLLTSLYTFDFWVA